MTRVRLASATVFLLLVSCAKEPAGPSPEERAAKAADALMQRLFARLSEALAAGPAHQALHVCADVAQDITADVAREQGVSIRRTALRVRNPANAPDAYERTWMERATAKGASPGGPHAERVGQELRFLRPVIAAPLCTQCHGPPDQIDPRVRDALRERYPEDRATGFAAGDFRGVISVRVPLP
jgi:hypothetical protein